MSPAPRRWTVLLRGAAACTLLALQMPAMAQVSLETLLAWVQSSGDNQGADFVVVDKQAAQIHVFDGRGHARASSPVLVGLAPGDRSVPGIGERNMRDIRPEERTTPAGRFVTEPGLNLQHEDIVWIDYDAAVSMHRVRATQAAERRLERLATPTPLDNRISYGCVNVPAAFYDAYIQPIWGQRRGLVYVLPETLSFDTAFGAP
jgi:hypothetical protein